VNLLDALADPQLFAPHFAGDTWEPWKALLRAISGLPLSESDHALFASLTGRTEAPREPSREVWIAAGRRSGKSRIAAACATWIACSRRWHDALAAGERATVMLIAADRKQARVLHRYVRGLLEAPLLARLVERETADSIDLSNGATIEIHTASMRTTRGYSCAAVIADEVAFWRDEASASPDVEVLNALRPSLATLPGSLLLALSSPYSRRGALYGAWERHWGRDGDPVLYVQAPTRTLNPSLDQGIIDAALEADESAARSEWLAEFRLDLEALFDLDAIRACVRSGHLELPPCADLHYQGFYDASGGRSDAAALAIGHVEADRAVVDLVRRWPAPHSPESVVSEAVVLLRDYRIAAVLGDRYAGSWPSEAFARHGIRYDLAGVVKSELYLSLLGAVNGGRVELPDHPVLVRELRDLERRRGRSGKDSVDHPRGLHDDVANVVAGVVHGLIGHAPVCSWDSLYAAGWNQAPEEPEHVVRLGATDGDHPT
jgi:hypothetical protein